MARNNTLGPLGFGLDGSASKASEFWARFGIPDETLSGIVCISIGLLSDWEEPPTLTVHLPAGRVRFSDMSWK